MQAFSVPYAEQPVLPPFRKGSMSMIHAVALLCHRRTNNGGITCISMCVPARACVWARVHVYVWWN